jgi:hypothetical protein
MKKIYWIVLIILILSLVAIALFMSNYTESDKVGISRLDMISKAISSGNAEYCAQVPKNKYYSDMCYYYMALKQRNDSLCEDVLYTFSGNAYRKDACINSVEALTQNNNDYCWNATFMTGISNCNLYFGIMNMDSEKCNSNYCYIYMAYINSNSTLCNMIEDDPFNDAIENEETRTYCMALATSNPQLCEDFMCEYLVASKTGNTSLCNSLDTSKYDIVDAEQAMFAYSIAEENEDNETIQYLCTKNIEYFLPSDFVVLQAIMH